MIRAIWKAIRPHPFQRDVKPHLDLVQTYVEDAEADKAEAAAEIAELRQQKDRRQPRRSAMEIAFILEPGERKRGVD